MYTPTFLQRNKTARSWAERLLLLVLFVATGFSSFAQSITGPDYIYVNTSKSPTGATTTYGAFNGANASGGTFGVNTLGTYALGTGGASDEQLLFNGGQVVTSEPNSGNTNVRVKSAQLYYRVYQQGAVAGGFVSLDLPEDLTMTVVGASTTSRTFNLNNANIDLIGAVSGGGAYVIELYLQANYQDAAGVISAITPLDDRNGSRYIGQFTVTGARANTTVWNGGISDNWFDPGNWSAGVPNSGIDAFIRFPNPGATVPYPRIYANSNYQRPTGNINYPVYNQNGAAYGAAEVKSLSFGGSSATARATSELVTGNLLIYGNFTNNFDNITQDANTVITFAGNQSQNIEGGGAFKTVCISGGTTKSLTGNMKIDTELHFGPPTDLAFNIGKSVPTITGKGILAVNGSNSNNVVTLQNASGVQAMLTGETDNGYVLGLTTTQAIAIPGTPQSFGNIGITLNFMGNAPGQVNINRVTGQPYTGANFSNPNSVSIKRSFEVTAANPATADGGLRATLTFNYLDADRMSVGSGNVTVSEASLYLAYSNNSTSFRAIGNNLVRDPNANTLTASNIDAFAIFTLADTQNPLPVSLVAFNAKRSGDNALITWETAMERDNRGFEVEVSTDGVTFRTLGFIASTSPNSNKRLAYNYTDIEANKSGIRYYRLHQIDLNGQDDYSPVRAVSFAAAGEAVAALSAYPNPFTNDEIKLALQSSDAGQATLRLTDLTGRQVSAQTFTAVKGVTEVSIDQASQLAAGSYMAQITAPSGEIKTVRIQKR